MNTKICFVKITIARYIKILQMVKVVKCGPFKPILYICHLLIHIPPITNHAKKIRRVKSETFLLPGIILIFRLLKLDWRTQIVTTFYNRGIGIKPIESLHYQDVIQS